MPFDGCAILIPTRNRPERLRETVRALRNSQLAHLPLYVYDDASEDSDTVRRCVAEWPGVTVVRGERRRGQAAGRNELLERCEQEYAILLDDDMSFMEYDNLQGYLTTPHRVDDPAVVSFVYVRLRDGKRSSDAKAACETTNFLGGGALMHVKSVQSVGGFRSFFVYGQEEPELAMRLWLNGYRLIHDPSIVLAHNHREAPSEHRNPREYAYLYGRNMVLTQTLNFPLLISLPFGCIKALRFVLCHRGNRLVALWGLMDGVWMTFAKWRERTPASCKTFFAWRNHVRQANMHRGA